MTLQINAERLWANLMEMAELGGTQNGGCNRQALTDTDIEGRMLFKKWCDEIGLTTTVYAAGNVFARRDGADNLRAPLVIGSHLDTQPTGGKFDGVLGVLAGLEILRVLEENKISTSRPVEIVSWMNEEGARFAPAMMGSGVYANVFDIDEVRAITDSNGISVGEELDRHGLSEGADPADKRIHAYLELHIEQGPILEAEDVTIGVVTGAQAIRWYELTVIGDEAHAGPLPMNMRKDPMKAVSKIIDVVLKIGESDPNSRSTIGQLEARPGSRNVIPGSVYMSVDLRNPDEDKLASMDKEFQKRLESIGAQLPHLTIEAKQIWHSPVVKFDPALVASVRKGAQVHGFCHRDIISGAGHDALYVARRAPTTMIFIPCRDGISHNEREHCSAGANVLLTAVLNTLDGS